MSDVDPTPRFALRKPRSNKKLHLSLSDINQNADDIDALLGAPVFNGPPADPTEGQIYTDSSSNRIRVYSNGAWRSFMRSDDTINISTGTTGTLPLNRGGTGATTAAAARNALGLGNTAGALPIANGGTGGTSITSARNNLGIHMAAGSRSVSTTGTGPPWTAAVTYPAGRFSAAPFVVLSEHATTGSSTAPDANSATVSSNSATGFTVRVGTAAGLGNSRLFHWMAMQAY